jgi:hypothetical protein
MAKEKNAKENAEEKRKKKGCQPRHRVELNPLKAEADLRSLWNSEKHTKEQSCEVLAKLVDSRHITGRHFEHSALVQDIMVFLKERAEREGVCKVLKRCADALCFWSAAGALQQQRKSGQDTLRTGAQIRSPPAARPVRKLGGAGKALLLAGLVVLALEVAGCVWLEPYVKTGLVDWRVSSTAPPPAPNQTQDSGCLLVLLVLKAVGVWGVAFVVQQHQSAQAVERAVPDRKQVVMQKAVKRMQERGLPGAALTLFALCLSLLLSNARGAECTSGGSLPCSFGGCEFSKDANGVLDRTGSCPTQTGTLYLDNRGIKGLREGVFSNMGACG